MATIQTDIEAALFARMASLVLSPAMPVSWPNVSFTKPTTGYLRVTHLPNRTGRLFLRGSDPHRRPGLMQVDVFKPLGKGSTPATETAGLVAAHFPAGLRLISGLASLRIVKAADVAPAIAEDTHWMVPVTVTYETFK